LHLAQKMFGRAQHLCQGSEPGQQGLGHGLCVRARNEPEQQKLEKFIVGQSFVAGGGKPLPQPVAMAQIVRLFSAGSLFFKRPQWLLPEKSSLASPVAVHAADSLSADHSSYSAGLEKPPPAILHSRRAVRMLRRGRDDPARQGKV